MEQNKIVILSFFFMAQSDDICYDTKKFSHEVLKMKRYIASVLMILLFTYSVMPAISTEVDISAIRHSTWRLLRSV